MLRHHNFYCIDMTLRVTPTMEARCPDYDWSIEEMLGILDAKAQAHTVNETSN
jgi:hypothetical protein